MDAEGVLSLASSGSIANFDGSRLCIATLRGCDASGTREMSDFGIVHLHSGMKARLSGMHSRVRGRRPLGLPSRIPARAAAGGAARADPDPAAGAHRLHPPDRGDPSAGAAAAGDGKLDHRRLRLHPEALRFDAARHHLPGRRRRQGLDFRHLFAAAREPHPYRLQCAVAAAVRQRAGAALRRGAVFCLHGGDSGRRRARASVDP
ncbi:hypothetical protein ACVWY2_002367 [Bradyrhizobium sp. JR6.1]